MVQHADIDHTGIPGTGSASLDSDRAVDTATAIQTTTSATYVDVTGMSVTVTTGARRVLVAVCCVVDSTSAAGAIWLDLDIDGTSQGTVGTATGLMSVAVSSASEAQNGSFTYLSAPLTAGSHTIKLRMKSPGGQTIRFYQGGTGLMPVLSVIEVL